MAPARISVAESSISVESSRSSCEARHAAADDCSRLLQFAGGFERFAVVEALRGAINSMARMCSAFSTIWRSLRAEVMPIET